MKTIFFKPNLALLSVLLLLLVTSLPACKKDKDENKLSKQLVGEWDIKSFKIDGVEFINLLLISSTVEFKKTDGKLGDYNWNFFYVDGTSTFANGEYEVDEKSKEIMIDVDTEYEIAYEAELDGDELILTANDEGTRYFLRLERN